MVVAQVINSWKELPTATRSKIIKKLETRAAKKIERSHN
jgi:hypothetical protein